MSQRQDFLTFRWCPKGRTPLLSGDVPMLYNGTAKSAQFHSHKCPRSVQRASTWQCCFPFNASLATKGQTDTHSQHAPFLPDPNSSPPSSIQRCRAASRLSSSLSTVRVGYVTPSPRLKQSTSRHGQKVIIIIWIASIAKYNNVPHSVYLCVRMYSLLAIQTSGAPLTPQPPSWVYQPSFLSSSPYVGKLKKATTKERKKDFFNGKTNKWEHYTQNDGSC